MLKKSFKVPFEENDIYPSYSRTMIAILKYCNKKEEFCIFIGENEVEIDGRRYEICRKFKKGNTGICGIECVEI